MNDEVRGYLMTGECGHRRPIRSTGFVDPCACDRTTASRGPDYFEKLATAVEEIGRLRWTLRQIIALADESPELTDAQLRDRLTALADRTRRR